MKGSLICSVGAAVLGVAGAIFGGREKAAESAALNQKAIEAATSVAKQTARTVSNEAMERYIKENFS